jgi:hypothetical protein
MVRRAAHPGLPNIVAERRAIGLVLDRAAAAQQQPPEALARGDGPPGDELRYEGLHPRVQLRELRGAVL